MSFYDMVTAEELAEFFRTNDGNRGELALRDDSYIAFEEWTANQFDAVVEAAKRNTSVRSFTIDVDSLAFPGAVVIAETITSFVRHLRNLRSVDICDTHDVDDFNPAPVAVYDALLRGIIEGDAENITSLRLTAAHLSPGLFLQFAKRFPHLKSLALSGPCARWNGCGCPHCANQCRQCLDYRDFATDVAIAVSRHLRSLRRLSLEVRCMLPLMATFLSDVGGAASATLKELRIVVGMCTGENEQMRLQDAVARFCVLTQTLETLTVVRKDEKHVLPLLDVTHMFGVWSRHPISDSIREIQLERCKLTDAIAYEGTLKKLDVLRLTNSHLDTALNVLKNLPRLKSFLCIYKNPLDDDWDTERDWPSYLKNRRGFLTDNTKLEVLCEAIERPNSSIQDVQIDLVGGYDGGPECDLSHSPYERFGASVRLLRACKGRLVVNFESLPVHSFRDIVNGMKSLRGDLKELRVRFTDCQFNDSQYSRIVKAVRRNKTLTVLEIGLDSWIAKNGAMSQICDLVSTNDTLDTLSIQGLGLVSARRFLDRVLPALASSTYTNLRTLQLHNVDLTGVWPHLQKRVLSMLDKNRVLSQLEGCTIPWNDPEASRVRHLLKLNRYGRRFLTTSNEQDRRVPKGLWGTILARIAQDNAHEVMYAFLQAKLASLLHKSAYDPPSSPSGDDPARRSGRKRGRPEEA